MPANKQKALFCLDFETLGVRIGIGSNERSLLRAVERHLPEILPLEIDFSADGPAGHFFEILWDGADGKIRVLKDKEQLFTLKSEERLIEYLSSRIRITVAEFAGSRVFLHAGVVGWKGKAIVIPGKSRSGKTLLVAELIRQGAVYYSDEYAVLDKEGFVHPFPKKLSVRGIINDFEQKDIEPEFFGARVGTGAIPAGLFLITSFEKGAVWNPTAPSAGQAMLEILQHTIPVRRRPEFVLKVLKKCITRAIIAESVRDEAKDTVPFIFELLRNGL